jgi:hypothetical protein
MVEISASLRERLRRFGLVAIIDGILLYRHASGKGKLLNLSHTPLLRAAVVTVDHSALPVCCCHF